MEAIRLHPSSDQSKPYSPTNPAPASALGLDTGLPIPQPLRPDEILVKVEATTVIRDVLTWPESYEREYQTLGNDFSGTVVAIYGEGSATGEFVPGDEIYGMTEASKAGTWAEYVIVTTDEACLKPRSLNWAEAAAVPLSGLTAYQALFGHAGLTWPDLSNLEASQEPQIPAESSSNSSILITGASGCVGLYMVQLAKLAGVYVVAATRSNARNQAILKQIGVDEVIEYAQLNDHAGRFPICIDSVGGQILESCWKYVKEGGTLISIDSASFDFVEEHRKSGVAQGREDVKAEFFIVSPIKEHLQRLSAVLDAKLLQPFVASIMALADASLACSASNAPKGRGKIILKPQHGTVAYDQKMQISTDQKQQPSSI